MDGRPGREARAAARAAADGVARRVGDEEPQLRRRRLGRVLPDARRDLEPGRVRRLSGQARAAGQVVPGQRRAGQEAAAGGGQADRRPELLRRVDRRRRAARRAVPRPLPDEARRGPGPARAAGARRRRPRRRAAATSPTAVAPAGGGGSSLGAAALPIAETQQGVHETGGANRGPQVEQYLAAAKVAPGQPVVRVVRDVVARAGRAQDAGRRLGRRPDVGAQRRAGQQRPPDRQRRGRAARGHRRL